MAEGPEGPELSSWTFVRLFKCMFSQPKIAVPLTTPYRGEIAVVTGGTGGIGYEIVRGLIERGLDTIVVGRSEKKLKETVEDFKAFGSARVDLADLETVETGAQEIKKLLGQRKIKVLVENAGVMPEKKGKTKQGLELAFGVNVLGHFALRNKLLDVMDKEPRVVCVTGDIYCRSKDCTPNFNGSGTDAYCRSKLGNIWIARELAKRQTSWSVCAVHPGVIATDLGGGGRALKAAMGLISPEQGAQMPLFCATQPRILSGAYYHNSYGLVPVRFPPTDSALHPQPGFWDTLVSLE